METKKHHIGGKKGEEISAVHHKASSEKWMFFCHGFGSDKGGSYEARAERAVKEGFNAVRFDFRGNGDSDGLFKEQYLSDKIKDLERVIDHFGPDKIHLFGMSFGGRVVFEVAQERDVDAVVGKSPVTYNSIMEKFRDAVEEKGEFNVLNDKYITESFFQDLDIYNFEEVLEDLKVPLAIFHGSEDTTVHFENSVETVEKYRGEALLYKLEGEAHSVSDRAEERIQEIMFAWLREIA